MVQRKNKRERQLQPKTMELLVDEDVESSATTFI
jgi:hypothetical protein